MQPEGHKNKLMIFTSQFKLIISMKTSQNLKQTLSKSGQQYEKATQ